MFNYFISLHVYPNEFLKPLFCLFDLINNILILEYFYSRYFCFVLLLMFSSFSCVSTQIEIQILDVFIDALSLCIFLSRNSITADIGNFESLPF